MSVRRGLVIFDLDNTLIDRDRFFEERAEAIVEEQGLDPEAVNQMGRACQLPVAVAGAWPYCTHP